MNLENRISAFVELGEQLSTHKFTDEFYNKVESNNPWFVKENIIFAVQELSELLTKEKLTSWLSKYPDLNNNKEIKKVAVITAGNIPLVGFHDFLSVLISGNAILVKLSGKDNFLLKEIANLLIEIEPKFAGRIEFSDAIIKGFDAIITTGSNNSAKHFNYYFEKYPHIIRQNRNSVALLSGDESEERLFALADDIFKYFGLGCRNVSKLFIPQDMEIGRIFESFNNYAHYLNHNKYANNYDYNRSIYLMNNIKFLDNGFAILREDESYASPISVIYYQRYTDVNVVKQELEANSDIIQIVVSDMSEKFIKFGKAQKPDLNDYADNVDTIMFLTGL